MSLVNKFQSSLGLRLTAMFIAVALIPIVIVGLVSYQRASGSLEELALQALSAEAEGTSVESITFVEQFTADVLALSDTPPVQAIIRAPAPPWMGVFPGRTALSFSKFQYADKFCSSHI